MNMSGRFAAMNKWFFIGFALGGLAGAYAGLLSAPSKGGTMRRRMIDGTRPARVRLSGMYVHFGDKAREKAETIRQAI